MLPSFFPRFPTVKSPPWVRVTVVAFPASLLLGRLDFTSSEDDEVSVKRGRLLAEETPPFGFRCVLGHLGLFLPKEDDMPFPLAMGVFVGCVRLVLYEMLQLVVYIIRKLMHPSS